MSFSLFLLTSLLFIACASSVIGQAPSVTLTPPAAPTQLFTLTPVSNAGAPPAVEPGDAPLSADSGWTCNDFPCQDDIPGLLKRIQVPPGFHVEHVGEFPGTPMQITYGPDGRLYATVLENGTFSGAVYVMDQSGQTTRYSGTLISPLGLAFQPGTDVLYVSARVALDKGTGIWRIPRLSTGVGGDPQPVVTDLPCCMRVIDNQANGIAFGDDGSLYVGVGSLTDTNVNPPHSASAWRTVDPHEAAILRINPLTGEETVYASGIRNPYDVTFDSNGQLYATDNGLLTGEGGDRVLKVDQDANYGWPYYRELGCADCQIKPASVHVSPDLLDFKPFTLPRGIVAYTGSQFPSNMFNNLFVTLWAGGSDYGQRVIRIDPSKVGQDNYAPEAFVTGLIRPVDVTVAPDGSLVVVDYVYGHVWRIVYDQGVRTNNG
ncbi:MAG TPA: PQQ-dependent sugar dehydrogenase [Phototrophicaceae bacterium]|nr:PQQ-dependent sugar dehydrogenase [Phototrophicaceae bacterium]